jgi:hypothetical protein
MVLPLLFLPGFRSRLSPPSSQLVSLLSTVCVLALKIEKAGVSETLVSIYRVTGSGILNGRKYIDLQELAE